MPLDPSIPLSVKPGPTFDVMETLQGIQRMRLQQQAIESNRVLQQQRQQEMALKQRKEADLDKANAMMQTAYVQDPQTGVFVFNRPALEQSLVDAGLGNLWTDLSPKLDAYEQRTRNQNNEARAAQAHMADAVIAAGGDPTAFRVALTGLQKNRQIAPEVTKQLEDFIGLNPEPPIIMQAVKQYAQGLPEFRDLQAAREKERVDLEGKKATTRNTLAEAALREQEWSQGKPSSTYTEWRNYVNEETKAGRKPLAYNDYMTMDANRKRPVTMVNAQDLEKKLEDLITPAVGPDGKTQPAALVKQAVDGLIDANQVFNNSRYTPLAKAQFKAAILQADPDWNETRYKTRQNYTNGVSQPAKNIVALNTAANHMGLLYDLSLGLKNNDVQVVNRVVNWMRTNLGYSGPTDALMAARALGAETASALKGANAAATDPEIDNWVETNSTARSPEQFVSNAKTLGNILVGRMRPLQSQWQQSYGKKNYFPILDDYAQQQFNKVGVDTGMVTGRSAGGQVPPDVAGVLKGAKDGNYTLTDGTSWQVRNGVITRK